MKPPLPPGAVVVEEREIRPGVIEYRYAYPDRARTVPLTRISPPPQLIEGGRSSVPKIEIRTQRVPVEFSREAFSEISRARFVDTQLYEKETGGYLFGYQGDDGVLQITAATWDVEEQWPTSVRLREEPPDALGCWHTHPDNEGLELSQADWDSAADRAQWLRTVTLVVGWNGGWNGGVQARGYDLRREGEVIAARPLQLI